MENDGRCGWISWEGPDVANNLFCAREQTEFSLKLWLVGQHQTHVEEVHGSAGCSQF
jgi:hypothetical protein